MNARKIADLILAQALPMASSLGMLLATASLLGPSGRGQLALVTSTSSLVAAVAFCSLHVGASRAERSGDPTATRRVYRLALIIGLAIAASGSTLFALPPSVRIGQFDGTAIGLSAIGAGLSVVHLVLGRTRQALGESTVFRNSALAVALVYLIAGIPAALAFRSALPVIIVWFAALLLGIAVVAITPVARALPEHSARVSLREMTLRSLLVHVAVSGQQLLFRSDVVILGIFTSASALGVYSVAAPLAGLVWVVTEALSLLAFDNGTREGDSAGSGLRRILRMNLLMSGGVAIIIAAVAWFALPVILPEFEAARILVVLLLPGIVVQGYARIVLSHIGTRDDVRPTLLIGIASLVLSLLYVPFIAWLGVIGAAIGSTVIYTLQSLIVALIYNRYARSES